MPLKFNELDLQILDDETHLMYMAVTIVHTFFALFYRVIALKTLRDSENNDKKYKLVTNPETKK